MTLAQIILVTGAVLGGAVIASLLAARLRIPSLLLFLGIGLVIGSDVTGWVSFGDYELAQDIGIVALGADPVRRRPALRLVGDPAGPGPGGEPRGRRARS